MADQESGGEVMAYWLFKSEPDVFSFEMLKAKGKEGEEWTGVRNYQARNNMRAMKVGDKGFYYHSNIGKNIVGVCEVIKVAHPDSSTDDPRWECVDVRAIVDMPKPISIDDVKPVKELSKMVLINNSRLSVQPVTDDEWRVICEMGGLKLPPRMGE
jgi:predicted RNA-binding protein with PUA-like domain